MNLDRLAAPPVAVTTPKSRMDVWLTNLTEPEREAVLTAAADTAWAHTALQAVLTEEGAPEVSDTQFRRWRQKVSRGDR